jgi:hypothetical protein
MTNRNGVDDSAMTTAHKAKSGCRCFTLKVIVLLLLVSVLCLYIFWLWLDQCMITSIDSGDIVSARMKWCFERDLISFQVAPQLAYDTLKALIPHHIDLIPAKWVVLGVLYVDLKNGTKCVVIIYDTHENEAAFSINGWYYRGGKTSVLKLLFQKGYSDASGKVEWRNSETGKIIEEIKIKGAGRALIANEKNDEKTIPND